MLKKWVSVFLSVVMLSSLCSGVVFGEETLANNDYNTLDEQAEIMIQDSFDYQRREAIRQLADIRDNCTDRFIVKFKSETQPDIYSVAEKAYIMAKDAKNERVSQVIETIPKLRKNIGIAQTENEQMERILEEIKHEQSSAFFGFGKRSVTEVKPLQENKQVIYLNEKVDPKIFEQELEEKLNGEVEFIQPDYQLELATDKEVSLSIDVIPVTVGSEEQDINKTLPEGTVSDKTEQPISTDNTAAEQRVTEVGTAIEDILVEVEEETEDVAPELQEVIVAIIDTGLDTTHPDLIERIIEGYNFISENTIVYDEALGMEQAHGTHVAGIIAQTASNVKIMPLKCFENGRAYTSDLIEAIKYAEENGASIVNCSWGSTNNNPALREAMEHSELFFVCAAGNNRLNVDETPIYPASFGLGNSISVAALNQDNGFSYFSNYGTSIDISTLGREVESCFPDGERGTMNGTSMAAGFVSGAAAMAKGSEVESIKIKLIQTGDMLSNLQNKLKDGRVLNIKNLLENICPTEIIDCNPEDDFDVHGYQPTPEENWGLFNDLKSVQVVAGDDYSVIIKEDGSLWTWGDNGTGGLGNGTLMDSGTPMKVEGLIDIKMAAAGVGHTVALKEDGTVWTWGYNEYGQLGDGSTVDHRTPIKVSGLTDVKAIAAGTYHTVALKEDGTVWAWGENYCGQLGNAEFEPHNTPIKVSNLSDVNSIAAGAGHTVALKVDGTVWTWGDNSDGQLLGNETTISCTSTPVEVSCLTDVKSVAAGAFHTVALKEDGTVWAWGNNTCGQIGYGIDLSPINPVPNPYFPCAQAIAAGGYNTVVVDMSGKVYSCGDNSSYQLGTKEIKSRSLPEVVEGIINITDVDVGFYHVLALKEDGTVWTWGSNECGQLGYGTVSRCKTPMKIELTNINSIAAAGKYTLALKENGTVYMWGNYQYTSNESDPVTQRSVPTEISGLSGVRLIAAGKNRCAVLKEDDTVYFWENNNQSQLDDASTWNQVHNLTEVKKIVAGDNHIVALQEDGTIWAWGDNSYGQLGDGTKTYRDIPTKVSSLDGVKDIAVGGDHTVAVKMDGTVYTWGRNDSKQLGRETLANGGTPVKLSNLSGVISVAAGRWHTAAITESGQLYMWGNNTYGQVGNGSVSMTAPLSLTNMKETQSVAAGENHSIILDKRGNLYATGGNSYGQLGLGSKFQMEIAVSQIADMSDVQAIAAGAFHTVALKKDGTVYGWGWNAYGQLGDGNMKQCAVPHRIGYLINSPEDVDGTKTADSLELSCVTGEEYTLSVTASKMRSLNLTTFILTYDPAKLLITDLVGETWSKELAVGEYENVKIINVDQGSITFQSLNKDINQYWHWSGLINSIRFRALETGTTTIKVTCQ